MYRGLTGLGGEHISFDTDDIADVKRLPDLVVQGFVVTGTNIIPSHIDLDLTGMVLQYGETGLAHVAHAHDATGDANISEISLVLLAQVARPDLSGCDVDGECRSRIRIDAQVLQGRQFIPAYDLLFG